MDIDTVSPLMRDLEQELIIGDASEVVFKTRDFFEKKGFFPKIIIRNGTDIHPNKEDIVINLGKQSEEKVSVKWMDVEIIFDRKV